MSVSVFVIVRAGYLSKNDNIQQVATAHTHVASTPHIPEAIESLMQYLYTISTTVIAINGKNGKIMPVAKVDDRGRVLLPKKIRGRLGLKAGDELMVGERGEDTVVLKKVDIRALIDEMIENAKDVNLDELESEIEREANELAKQRYEAFRKPQSQ